MSHDPGIALGQIQDVFKFKGDTIEHPKIYLRDQVGKMFMDGAEGWYISAEKYVRAAVENIQQNIEKYNHCLRTCCKTPIMSRYHSETDTSPEPKYEGATQYQDIVGLIRRAVELEHVDNVLDKVIMSTYLSLPSRGNIKQVLHMFGYLKANTKRKICFYPQHVTINERSFAAHDWYNFY